MGLWTSQPILVANQSGFLSEESPALGSILPNASLNPTCTQNSAAKPGNEPANHPGFSLEESASLGPTCTQSSAAKPGMKWLTSLVSHWKNQHPLDSSFLMLLPHALRAVQPGLGMKWLTSLVPNRRSQQPLDLSFPTFFWTPHALRVVPLSL